MEEQLQAHQEKVVAFLRARQNVFGKVELEGLGEEERLVYLQKKLNMVMNYSEKDFQAVLKNK